MRVLLVKLEDEENALALQLILSHVYPGCGGSFSRERALAMLQDGSVYDTVRSIGRDIQFGGVTIRAVSNRFLQVEQERQTLRLSATQSLALDCLESIRRECTNIKGMGGEGECVINHLHLSNDDIHLNAAIQTRCIDVL